MIEAQGGSCAICGEEPVQWHVDHDHKSGKVRGMLCFNCNQGLGNFRDDLDDMQRAIDYLIEHSPRAEESSGFVVAELQPSGMPPIVVTAREVTPRLGRAV